MIVCHHVSGDCSVFPSQENERFSFICNLLQFLTKTRGVIQCCIVMLEECCSLLACHSLKLCFGVFSLLFVMNPNRLFDPLSTVKVQRVCKCLSVREQSKTTCSSEVGGK